MQFLQGMFELNETAANDRKDKSRFAGYGNFRIFGFEQRRFPKKRPSLISVNGMGNPKRRVLFKNGRM
ncbi:MAG: hypothetical protein ACOVRK_12940 [Chryseobacterium taeanense]